VNDPFHVLGLPVTATLAEVRAARRRLAQLLHPDVGGDEGRMREVNQAFDQAVRRLLGRPDRSDPPAPTAASPPPARSAAPRPAPAADPPRVVRTGPWIQYDEPSFTIDVRPGDAFVALARVAVGIGEILADDPPYVLEVLLRQPSLCWCRLELLAEGGGTTVMLTVAGVQHRAPPVVEDVRDVWVAALNAPVPES